MFSVFVLITTLLALTGRVFDHRNSPRHLVGNFFLLTGPIRRRRNQQQQQCEGFERNDRNLDADTS